MNALAPFAKCPRCGEPEHVDQCTLPERPVSYVTKFTVDNAEELKSLIREIAMDIGKEVVHHIEIMYPKAIDATPSTFKLSVRNCVHNEIIAAIQVSDEGEIIARLAERKAFRRKIKAAWSKISTRR